MEESAHLEDEDTEDVIIFKLEALLISKSDLEHNLFYFQLVGSPVSSQIILCPSGVDV